MIKAASGDAAKAGKTSPTKQRHIPRYLIVAFLVLLVLCTRLLPFSISHLPFNNDGLTESRIADDIASSGHLDYPDGASYVGSHSVVMPLFNLFLAFISSAIGTSAFDLSQVVIALVSILTVVGGYLISLQITRGIRAALVSALVLALLGTFLFTTGSVWKTALGMALFVFVIFAYINRVDRRFLVLEVLILGMLPLVSHLATIITYMAIVFMTVWSVFVAFRGNRIGTRHIIDSVIIILVSLAAYSYYTYVNLDRLSLVQSSLGMAYAGLAFAGVCLLMILVFSMKRHIRFTFAPLISILIFGLMSVDYFWPSFSYVSGSPSYVLVLAGSVAILAGFAWYGLELSVENKTKYSAVPLCLLLPFLALAGFAVFSGLTFNDQQILFRSFDFADIALAVGIGICLVRLRGVILWETRARDVPVFAILVVLLISMPFAYATQSLSGVRHDTQQYEVDAFQWLSDSSGNGTAVQSDERLSYIANSLEDIPKTPWLPRRLVAQETLGPGVYYVMEDEWRTKGVNNFPYGTPVIDARWTERVLDRSNVLYLGGPATDRIVIFEASELGWALPML